MSKVVYLLQNETAGYLGNAPLFYKEGGYGYTVNIDEAQRFTPTEAAAIIRGSRGSHQWKRWHVRDVLNSCMRVANIDELRRQTKLSKQKGTVTK